MNCDLVNITDRYPATYKSGSHSTSNKMICFRITTVFSLHIADSGRHALLLFILSFFSTRWDSICGYKNFGVLSGCLLGYSRLAKKKKVMRALFYTPAFSTMRYSSC